MVLLEIKMFVKIHSGFLRSLYWFLGSLKHQYIDSF